MDDVPYTSNSHKNLHLSGRLFETSSHSRKIGPIPGYISLLVKEIDQTINHQTDTKLEEELERLRRLSGLGQGLKVVWKPSPDKPLSGEVKGDTIYVYEVDEGRALEVLRHEFLDYCISQAIEPYRMVTNKLIKLINEEAYNRKERIVEALNRLLFERDIQD